MLYDQYVLVACRVNPVAAVTRIGRLYLSDVKYSFRRYVTQPFKSQEISHQVPCQKLSLSLIKYYCCEYFNQMFNPIMTVIQLNHLHISKIHVCLSNQFTDRLFPTKSNLGLYQHHQVRQKTPKHPHTIHI